MMLKFLHSLTLLPAVLTCVYNHIDSRHTMCVYSPQACTGKLFLASGKMTCQEKNKILDTHNKLRQKVALGQVPGQPGAMNMRQLVWDDELAGIAQRWADQCYPGHDRKRNTDRFTVGQNVAVTWTYENEPLEKDLPDWPKQINRWFDEVNQFGFSTENIDPFAFSRPLGHYTQMIWAESYMIGCGFAYFKDPQRGYSKIYVCNYGPGGNVIGASMYKKRIVGKKYCDYGTLRPSPLYPGLCEMEGVYYYTNMCESGLLYKVNNVLSAPNYQPSVAQYPNINQLYPQQSFFFHTQSTDEVKPVDDHVTNSVHPGTRPNNKAHKSNFDPLKGWRHLLHQVYNL